MIKLSAKELRVSQPQAEHLEQIAKNDVYIIVDNVMDTYNIGSIFRLADAIAAKKVYLCGGTETPPNSRIKKASINTTEWVAWEYVPSAIDAINRIKKQEARVKVFAIEQDPRSVPYDKADYTFPVVLVIGHETDGVSKDVLAIADQIVEMPMWGVNISLNVMVSLGIVLYEVMKHKRK